MIPDWPELAQARLEPLDEGMSEASVFRVNVQNRSVLYLKMAEGVAARALRDEIARTRWLAMQGVRVPAILRAVESDDRSAFLMKAMPGKPATESGLAPRMLAEALAEAVMALHALPVMSCPFDESFAVRLARAAEAVAAGEVDADGFDPRNDGLSPQDILARLTRDAPRGEDSVVIHGDLTLANIVIDPAGAVGFIDCGVAGRGDRMIDLALLASDLDETFGVEAHEAFINAYGAHRWDARRALYVLDLYELF